MHVVHATIHTPSIMTIPLIAASILLNATNILTASSAGTP